MDRRENTDDITYQKELEQERAENKAYEEYVEENGVKFRVPYKMVKEVTFTNLKKEELIDTEHSARLQYRLMLLDAVLFAKVEFVARKIKITYNPLEAESRKTKIGLQQIIDYLAKEGVHTSAQEMQERDIDYYNEIYKYQFSPPSIREHAPYGYTLEEWKKMKPEYEASKEIYEKEKLEKFHAWQHDYLIQHPELAAELGVKIEKEEAKPTFLGKIFKKQKKQEGEKGFWFHGV